MVFKISSSDTFFPLEVNSCFSLYLSALARFLQHLNQTTTRKEAESADGQK